MISKKFVASDLQGFLIVLLQRLYFGSNEQHFGAD